LGPALSDPSNIAESIKRLDRSVITGNAGPNYALAAFKVSIALASS
jgi:hypothetical protein